MAEQQPVEAVVSNDRQQFVDPTALRVPHDPTRPSWLSEVTVEHGPADVLARFFLKADEAARERGVTLSFGTFDELVATNAANTTTPTSSNSYGARATTPPAG